MLDSLSAPRRRFVLGAAGLVAAALAVVVLLVVRGGRAATPVAQDRPGPVVLVTGYGGSVASLSDLETTLTAVGRTAVVAPVLGDGTGDLRAQAEALGETVDRVLAESGAPSVDVVGYSAGGVVARLWVREYGGAGQARRVVSLGSPQHGTDLAELAGATGACGTACEQLAPDSDLLRRLNAGDETPAGPVWVSLWTTRDDVVTPPDSARLDGALDLTVQSVCPSDTSRHGDLPHDPVVLAALRTVLGAGSPRPPSSCPVAVG